MSMDRAAFEALVARMEALSTNDPAAYRRRVFGLALLGYGYLLIVVLVLIALCIFFVASVLYLKALAIKLLVLFGAPLPMVLRSMWIRMELPCGEQLTRESAPELFEMLAELRERLRTPPLHRVLLTPEFNAGVMQVPRLGLFGWHRNHLFIGLPLMKSLTAEQFRAVLAHELGHLSRGHARAGNWIYRLRLIWQRLEVSFSETPHWGATPIRAFLKWYIPRFSAASFPLARANEYEADASAVKLTSARSAAQALTAVGMVGSYLSEKYWPCIHSAARESPQPAFAPYSEFMATAIHEVPAAERREWLDKVLAARTSYGDTHPSLTDRLEAMGAEAEFAPPNADNSADKLLGAELGRLEQAFDAQWRERVAPSWKQVHDNTRANRRRIVELRKEAARSELDEPRALELADLEEDVGYGAQTALAMRRLLAAKYPDSLPLRFSLARQLLQTGRDEGVAPMESVMQREPGAVMPGAELLRDFYWRRNDTVLANRWQQRLLERAAEVQAAQRERDELRLSDTVVIHDLSHETVSELTRQLMSLAGLRRVYLVRKLTRHCENVPLYVLGFRTRAAWSLSNSARSSATLEQIRRDVKFPGETLVVSLDNSNSQFESKLRRLKGSRLI